MTFSFSSQPMGAFAQAVKGSYSLTDLILVKQNEGQWKIGRKFYTSIPFLGRFISLVYSRWKNPTSLHAAIEEFTASQAKSYGEFLEKLEKDSLTLSEKEVESLLRFQALFEQAISELKRKCAASEANLQQTGWTKMQLKSAEKKLLEIFNRALTWSASEDLSLSSTELIEKQTALKNARALYELAYRVYTKLPETFFNPDLKKRIESLPFPSLIQEKIYTLETLTQIKGNCLSQERILELRGSLEKHALSLANFADLEDDQILVILRDWAIARQVQTSHEISSFMCSHQNSLRPLFAKIAARIPEDQLSIALNPKFKEICALIAEYFPEKEFKQTASIRKYYHDLTIVERLPLELWLKIFTNLSFCDQAKLGLTSRYFANLYSALKQSCHKFAKAIVSQWLKNYEHPPQYPGLQGHLKFLLDGFSKNPYLLCPSKGLFVTRCERREVEKNLKENQSTQKKEDPPTQKAEPKRLAFYNSVREAFTRNFSLVESNNSLSLTFAFTFSAAVKKPRVKAKHFLSYFGMQISIEEEYVPHSYQIYHMDMIKIFFAMIEKFNTIEFKGFAKAFDLISKHSVKQIL
ncbi:F-box protein [Parachlamydia sp. AcF125]|uniref:F-box protein n=1 Tax=Parachlamydia sp. AcF125 TaxID=2795736 RepID=UPI001BCA54BA|nr:F-box protein [Parachlamydia sp. AcF125]MBS4168124.1 hypothetical protein [Parachlamydia sp. AcF125]